jgi:sporulation protein YunB
MHVADKLYSRWRIKLPDIREYKSVKSILLIAFFMILISIAMFIKSAYPVFKSSCETAASSKGNKIINDEVYKVMQNYTYNDLIKIDKDINGKISLIEANSVKINEITSLINANIQKEFDKIPTITVFINMGAVSGISILKNIEPKMDIELESAGNIKSIVKTEFKAVGINQTHHKIYLDIDARVGILTPFSAFGKDINTDVLISEAIIIGEVPETYYNLEGMDETEDTYNFIE